MITIVYNETNKSIDIMLDDKGADLLIEKLQKLKFDGQRIDHLHVYATDDDSGLSLKSPYDHKNVYGELVFDWLPPEAWNDK